MQLTALNSFPSLHLLIKLPRLKKKYIKYNNIHYFLKIVPVIASSCTS